MTAGQKSGEKFAVVTGASHGLGKAFSVALARKKINLVLVSLPDQKLADIGQALSVRYGVKTACYETDLTSIENVLALTNWINDNFDVEILINNAGIGGSKGFVDAEVEYINTIIQLNIMSTSILTHQLLPNLLKQKQSYILNISSMAAFLPMGYKTVYPASKSFIHSFSLGLYTELKDMNVFVSVAFPGVMKTNGDVSARISSQGFFGKLTLMEPERVADYCLQQLFKKNRVIILNPVVGTILRILPNWIKLPLLTRAMKKESEL
ncbi:MAG TPA: SDR family NAD(P)-dependent oxidoreductase [Prolixibacteraceae bacterium]|nr:SDR family NAD(P)-dependent oxidoreductase [Prolixibacteraceae bacterium]